MYRNVMSHLMTGARLFWMLAVAWACLIFILSSIPGRSLPNIGALNHDKLLHATVYAVLGGLCFVAAKKTFATGPTGIVVVAVAIATLYGLTDEFHQLFVPGRSADLQDAAADATGALAGACVALGLLARKSAKTGS